MDATPQVFLHGLTFDDVLLLPGFTDFTRGDIDLSTKLTKKITLQIPLVSSPMDTVTGEKLAISLGQSGGIGIIHRNLSVQQQAKEVANAKKTHLDAAGRSILAGAAVGANKGYEERVDVLIKAGADVLIVDSAHGYSLPVIDAIKWIKQKYSATQVIGGNISTFDAAEALIKAGADGLRVGMGPGAICTTRIVSGMGVPQVTAIFETSRA